MNFFYFYYFKILEKLFRRDRCGTVTVSSPNRDPTATVSYRKHNRDHDQYKKCNDTVTIRLRYGHGTVTISHNDDGKMQVL
jgi:hypothetical protein